MKSKYLTNLRVVKKNRVNYIVNDYNQLIAEIDLHRTSVFNPLSIGEQQAVSNLIISAPKMFELLSSLENDNNTIPKSMFEEIK